MKRTIYGDRPHREIATSLNGLGQVCVLEDDARRHFEEALQMSIVTFGEEHPHTETIKRNLAIMPMVRGLGCLQGAARLAPMEMHCCSVCGARSSILLK